MSDETTLLLCPFCEGEPWEPIPKRWTNAIGDESWSAFVHCPECEITVDTECGYETAEAAIEAAVRKWNTRATVGNGTCENANKNGYGFRFDCTECGYSTIVLNCATRLDELPNFCPKCGRWVKR